MVWMNLNIRKLQKIRYGVYWCTDVFLVLGHLQPSLWHCMGFTHNGHHHCKKTSPPAINLLTGCRPADISPALFLMIVQLFNNWRVGKVVTDGLVSADQQPPWWRGPVGSHDDAIKWKHFPRYWPFLRGIHRSPVNSPHKGQWRGALKFSLICTWINAW